MSDKQVERLKNLVGFDPVRQPRLTNEIFREVMEEINATRAEKARSRARELLEKAFLLREQMAKARSDFERQEAKFDKELGKILSRLESEIHGSNSPAEEEPEKEKEAESGGEV
jgi:hypothetical protein